MTKKAQLTDDQRREKLVAINPAFGGHLKSWHTPFNDECENNENMLRDCTCKKKRKPYRVIRVYDKSVNHGVNPNLVITVHPHGEITIREAKRSLKSAITTTAGDIYAVGVRSNALKALRERNAARAQRRKDAKIERKRQLQLRKGVRS